MAEEQTRLLLEEIAPLLEAGDRDALRRWLDDQRESDVAELVETVDRDQARLIFDAMAPPEAALVFLKVNEATRTRLFEMLDEREIQGIFSELDSDDATDLLAELPDDAAETVLAGLGRTEAFDIRRLMRYSPDSAGGIMDPVVISVPADATIGDTVNKIRAAEIDEDFYFIYVVDEGGRFLGQVRLRLLLTRPETARIGELIEPDPVYVTVDMDQEEVRNIFRKNDLLVVPVLDRDRRLVGRITADRVIEVAEEEAVEDLYVMAGTNPDELESFSAVHAARVRMTWLLPALLGTGITATILTVFRAHNPTIYLTAVAFAPMIAAISGNAGLQTSAIVVSGLATGHLAALRLATVLSREVRIAVLVALSCALLGATACAVLIHTRTSTAGATHAPPGQLVVAFGVAMFSAIMVATTLGLLLPFAFRRLGIDPAISAGPLVTTANDSISVAIYMTLAVLLAGGSPP
jgi:magnesium transporter